MVVLGFIGRMRPTWLGLNSANQRLPSGPAAIALKMVPAGNGNSVMTLGLAGAMCPSWVP